MAHERTDTETTTIRSKYTWSYLSGHTNAAHIRYYYIACYQTESEDRSPMWANKPSNMQNPPKGPPRLL